MSSSELLIFNDYNKSMVLYRKVDRITVFSERASIQEENRSLANYRSKFDIPLENLQWNNSYLVQTKTRRILRVDSLGLYKYKSVKPDIVILQNSPKINLSRLILELKPDLIVADGTNFSSYINKWEATCVKTKTPFHSTNRKGAFILKEKVLIR
jgi:competence protein ComEC